jgi:hypothetical protein
MEDSKKDINEIMEEFDINFNTTLNELSEEAKEDLKFGKTNKEGMESEIMRNIANLHKWSDKYARYSQNFKRSHNSTTRIYAKEYERCRREMLDIAMKGKSEIETWICQQSNYVRAKSYQNDLECICEFIEKTLDALKSKGYAIRNIIDSRKYFDGN